MDRPRITWAPRKGLEAYLGCGLLQALGGDAALLEEVLRTAEPLRPRQVVAEMARSAGIDAGSLTGPTLAVARRLVALGFLVPAER